MNNLIRTSVLAIAFFTTAISVQAKGTSLLYSRNANTNIGVTPTNQVAVGSIYKILDSKGSVVLQGRILSGNTFYIPTRKLENGNYKFSVDGFILQEFSIGD